MYTAPCRCPRVKVGAHNVQVMAVEVLWTPQDENDSYTKDDLFFDYPSLNTL